MDPQHVQRFSRDPNADRDEGNRFVVPADDKRRGDEKVTAFLQLESAIRGCSIGSKGSLQRGAKFREETGNGLRVWVTRNEDHKPKTKKENYIMKNRKNILTYVVAAVVPLVVSANSSLGTQPLQGPENYNGSLTHGEFVSCEGQILNPPAYAVDGTWVLHIERMTEPQVPPPASLTMVVFRDGHRYFVLPHIELTPVSLEDGIYTYNWADLATATLDTNTTPATFAWHVVFDDNCTTRSYGMLTYFGLANN